jgi:hypothetical protein
MLIIRNFGRRRMRVAGNAVRSRIVKRISKSASAAAASSSVPNASAKNTSSARAARADQSALLRATSCQSSRTAILTMIVSSVAVVASQRAMSLLAAFPVGAGS